MNGDPMVSNDRPGAGVGETNVVSRVESFDADSMALRVAVAMKAGLAVAFVIAVAVPLDHLEGKGMGFRFPLFMASTVVVPLAWRRRFRPYPSTADTLVVAPFLVDTLGNLLGIYDSFAATDDVLHFLNWVLLIGAFHAWRFRRTTLTGDAVLLGAGIGALAIVGWEIAEWIVAETGAGGGLNLSYGDTVGDLALSTAGGIVGSVAAVALFGPRRERL